MLRTPTAASRGKRPISPTSCAPPSERSTLYGRRKGRRLRAGRQGLVDTLLPELSLDVSGDGGRLAPAALFARPVNDLWVEVGFGSGEHLAAQAAACRDVGFIGVEPFVNGIARLLADVDEAKLDNLRIVADDARLLLRRLPDASVGRLFVLFPDPWRKTRHHKRRIVGPSTLPDFARILADGAELRLATDHAGYLAWMLEHVRADGRFEWLARRPADWRDRPPDWPATRYEEKARRAGRNCAFLRFRRLPRAAAPV